MIELLTCHREDCAPTLETEPPVLVRCSVCGLAGAVGMTEAESAEEWNREINARLDVYFGRKR